MFGVYIHFPYCRKRCPYCDFAVHARLRIPHDRYADAVVRECEARAPLFDGRAPSTIYFGGGTPGLWRPDCIERVIAAVTTRFPGSELREVTVEANPDELLREQLEGLRRAGVTRLSIGVESFERKHLHTLGRLHSGDEARAAVANARSAGFSALSLDLMFGLPGQTLQELDRDVDELLALEPEHISIYNLTIEDRTAFGALHKRGLLKVPDDGLCADMYERIQSRARRAGFQHYEISSWARPGHRAVHNSIYWTGGEYLGLGCSAHSLRLAATGGARFSTIRSVDPYLAQVHACGGVPLDADPLIASVEELDAAALDREAVWLGLRLLDGIDRRDHARRHGADPVMTHAAEVERLTREGLIEVGPERLRLTARGVLFADEVGARFL